jgi:hypothetical protein
MLAIETVAVLGDGEATLDVALMAALAGCDVRLHHPVAPALDAAAEWIRYRVDLAIEQGLLTRSDRQHILDGILFTPDLAEATISADLVVALGAETFGPGLDPGQVVELIRATAALAVQSVAVAADLAGRISQPGRAVALAVVRDGGLARLAFEAAPTTSRHVLGAAAAFAVRANGRWGR